jgi:RNA polymerase sigma factor (sigma-70 family)
LTEADGERRRRFDALFREQVEGIASYCRWRSRSRSDAEDAVAEVFLIAWRRLDDVPAGDNARPWLYAAARRVMANQARANARRRRLNQRLNAEAAAAPAEEDPRISRVHDALAALDPRDREVLLLAEWEGLTPAEIGRAMHRPPVTVRVRLHRARRRFRVAFESHATDAVTAAHSFIPPLAGRREP